MSHLYYLYSGLTPSAVHRGECRPSRSLLHFTCTFLVLILHLFLPKPSVVHTFKPNMWEIELEIDLWIWGQSCLCGEFHDNQGYIDKPYLKKKKGKQTNKKHFFFPEILPISQSVSPDHQFLKTLPLDHLSWTIPSTAVASVAIDANITPSLGLRH